MLAWPFLLAILCGFWFVGSIVVVVRRGYARGSYDEMRTRDLFRNACLMLMLSAIGGAGVVGMMLARPAGPFVVAPSLAFATLSLAIAACVAGALGIAFGKHVLSGVEPGTKPPFTLDPARADARERTMRRTLTVTRYAILVALLSGAAAAAYAHGTPVLVVVVVPVLACASVIGLVLRGSPMAAIAAKVQSQGLSLGDARAYACLLQAIVWLVTGGCCAAVIWVVALGSPSDIEHPSTRIAVICGGVGAVYLVALAVLVLVTFVQFRERTSA